MAYSIFYKCLEHYSSKWYSLLWCLDDGDGEHYVTRQPIIFNRCCTISLLISCRAVHLSVPSLHPLNLSLAAYHLESHPLLCPPCLPGCMSSTFWSEFSLSNAFDFIDFPGRESMGWSPRPLVDCWLTMDLRWRLWNHTHTRTRRLLGSCL